jgi:hypothetical protein
VSAELSDTGDVMGNRTWPGRNHHEAPEDVGTLWTMQRLESSARCALMACSGGWEVRVLVDGTLLLAEQCARADAACHLADRWKQRMLQDGWHQIVPRESRRPVPHNPQSA